MAEGPTAATLLFQLLLFVVGWYMVFLFGVSAITQFAVIVGRMFPRAPDLSAGVAFVTGSWLCMRVGTWLAASLSWLPKFQTTNYGGGTGKGANA